MQSQPREQTSRLVSRSMLPQFPRPSPGEQLDMLVMAAGVFSVLAYLGSQTNTIMMSHNIDDIDIVILEHNLRNVCPGF